MAIQNVELDYLNPGAIVKVMTSLNTEVTGVVVACNGIQRMLLLKSHRQDQHADLDDLHLINMDQVVDVEVIKDVDLFDNNESSSSLEPDICHVDISEGQNRLKQNVAAKQQKSSRPAQGSSKPHQ